MRSSSVVRPLIHLFFVTRSEILAEVNVDGDLTKVDSDLLDCNSV
jgi:hypothetical protein